MVLPPVPEREGRVAPELVAERVVEEEAGVVPGRGLEPAGRRTPRAWRRRIRARTGAAGGGRAPPGSRTRAARRAGWRTSSTPTARSGRRARPARWRRRTPRRAGPAGSRRSCSSSRRTARTARRPRRRQAPPPAGRRRTASPRARARACTAGPRGSTWRGRPAACPTSRSSRRRRTPGRYASYATGPYVSPSASAASQRPFVWIRSRISPVASAGPHAGRSPSIGKLPYGLWPWAIRSAPITPERPTSITFESVTLSPIRNPSRKTVGPDQHPDGPDGRAARRPVAQARSRCSERSATRAPDRRTTSRRRRGRG